MTARVPFATVVVPAHDEAHTIEACLASILDDEHHDQLDVIVVCNGCQDDTADRARRMGPPVRVIEREQPSKAAALEAGRQAATAHPIMYIDADVTLSPNAVTAVARTLDREGVLAAAPVVRMQRADASVPMRLFLDTWLRAPYFSEGLIGAGFYAVNAAGAARMGAFPAIVADDMFALTRFSSDERAVAADARFSPLVSRRLRDLLRVEVRREAARSEFMEWAETTGTEVHHDENTRWLLHLARDPRRWPGLAVFIPAKVLTRLRAAIRRRTADPQQWSRDDHARAQAGAS